MCKGHTECGSGGTKEADCDKAYPDSNKLNSRKIDSLWTVSLCSAVLLVVWDLGSNKAWLTRMT